MSASGPSGPLVVIGKGLIFLGKSLHNFMLPEGAAQNVFLCVRPVNLVHANFQ